MITGSSQSMPLTGSQDQAGSRSRSRWLITAETPSDRMLIVLLDVRKGSRSEGARMRLMLGNGASKLLRIPPGVAHGLRNLAVTTGRVIYFTDLHFTAQPSQCDEGRLPWDFAGADIWEPTKG